MITHARDFQIPQDPVGKSAGEIISTLFSYSIPIAGILMLLMIIFGGYQLMTSGGEPEGIQSAKSKITLGIVGFLIVFSSWFIIRIIEVVFGIDILGF